MRQPSSALPRSRIRRLVLRQTPSTMPLHARWALASEVAQTDLDSSETADALVLIRQVAIQRRARHDRNDRPGALLRLRVGEIARQAVRPVGARLPADAPGVILADWAEALAVLAVSACEHRVRAEWWWSLLWEENDAENWVRRWLEQPSAVPSAWQILAREGHGSLVLAALDEDDGERLLRSLAQRYALPHVLQAVSRWRGDTSNAAWMGSRTLPIQKAEPAALRPTPEPPQAIAAWDGIAEESPFLAAISPGPVRAWACLAMALRRGQAWVRRAEFVNDWLRELDGASRPANPSEEQRASTARSIIVPPNPKTAGPVGDQLDPTAEADGARPSPMPALSSAENGPASATDAELSPEAWEDSRNVPAAGSEDVASVRGSETRLATEAVWSVPWMDEPPGETVFSTECGGVFYLANVALLMGYYGDFTQPQRPGLPFPFWDFLTGVALRLCSPDQRMRFREDPLWAWLARQSGRRPEEEPGEEMAWSAELDEAWPRWMRAGNDESCRQPAPLIHGWEAALADVAAGVERRMENALGTAPGPFLREPARVRDQPGSVRVHFNLSNHPLAVRCAGLDRDPGWIPAAGVDLRFIYE